MPGLCVVARQGAAPALTSIGGKATFGDAVSFAAALVAREDLRREYRGQHSAKCQAGRCGWGASTWTAPTRKAMAAFYGRLLGWEITYQDWDFIAMADPQGGVGVSFQEYTDYRPPVWPEQPGAQAKMLHLDMSVDDLDAAVAHALASGARLAEYQGRDDLRVMLDPAGHPFCLCTRVGFRLVGWSAGRPERSREARTAAQRGGAGAGGCGGASAGRPWAARPAMPTRILGLARRLGALGRAEGEYLIRWPRIRVRIGHSRGLIDVLHVVSTRQACAANDNLTISIFEAWDSAECWLAFWHRVTLKGVRIANILLQAIR